MFYYLLICDIWKTEVTFMFLISLKITTTSRMNFYCKEIY